MNEIYDEYTDLLGAYALDAVDGDERERIERHLLECPRCRAEVAEHREVASFLAQSGTDAPDGVWDRISAELAPEPPPLRLVGEPLPERAPARRGLGPKAAALLLGAAAVIVAVLGIVTVGQSQRLNRLEDAMSGRSIERVANAAVADAPVKVDLAGDAGKAEVVVGSNGQGYLITKGMPKPSDGDVYQLWGKDGDVVLSLGTFGGDTEVVPFSVDPNRVGDLELFAVTQERAPGVLASKQQPLMVGKV
ncbi:MAG: anti-sigma factor [Acidimicrobiales bacterium]